MSGHLSENLVAIETTTQKAGWWGGWQVSWAQTFFRDRFFFFALFFGGETHLVFLIHIHRGQSPPHT